MLLCKINLRSMLLVSHKHAPSNLSSLQQLHPKRCITTLRGCAQLFNAPHKKYCGHACSMPSRLPAHTALPCSPLHYNINTGRHTCRVLNTDTSDATDLGKGALQRRVWHLVIAPSLFLCRDDQWCIPQQHSIHTNPCAASLRIPRFTSIAHPMFHMFHIQRPLIPSSSSHS